MSPVPPSTSSTGLDVHYVGIAWEYGVVGGLAKAPNMLHRDWLLLPCRLLSMNVTSKLALDIQGSGV
jgi:hypothetical protein